MSQNARLACLVAIAGLAAAGCGIDLSNGGLSCSSDGRCPPGYHCAVDNSCWKNGQDPVGSGDDMGIPGDGGDDSGVSGPDDLTPPPDLAPTLTNGQLCGSKEQCISGFCADGVCCDAACTDSCKSCNQPTNLGKCSALGDGANPAHGTCGPDAKTSCGRDGFCAADGTCRLYGNTTVCLAGSCDPTSNKATSDSKCDGAGHCVTPTAILCDPYVCNGTTACFASCTTTAQCKGGMPCNSMQCGPKTNGSPCTTGTECQSMNCVDGVCCNTPASSCSGCKQCNLASSLGTCANVPAGQDPHTTCATNSATCTAGGCNGSNACTPSANTVVCATSCANGNQLSTTLCNGVATGCTNTPTTAACPSSLVCKDTTSCQPNCSTNGDADCVSGFYCASGNCTAKKANGSSCSANDQCTSGICGSFHRDADGDGQGVLAVTMFCGSTPPSGYVTNSTDCCDADINVHQGQTGWFSSAATACGASFFDYDCSGVTEHEFTAVGQCSATGSCSLADPLTCHRAVGWLVPEPGCPGSGTWMSNCAVASACSPCTDPGSCGAPCGQESTITQTQFCH